MWHESVGPKVIDDGRPENIIVAFLEGEAVGGDAGYVGEPVGNGAVCVGADEVLKSRRGIEGAGVRFRSFTRVRSVSDAWNAGWRWHGHTSSPSYPYRIETGIKYTRGLDYTAVTLIYTPATRHAQWDTPLP